MIQKLSATKLVVAGFLIIIAAMSIYIYTIYSKTSAPATNITIEPEQKPQPQESARAFVKIGKYTTSTRRGNSWSIDMNGPVWAKCMADVYGPDSIVRQFSDPQEAEATIVTPGSFKWNWKVPREAVSGDWTIRLLCGTFDNLATADVAVKVE